MKKLFWKAYSDVQFHFGGWRTVWAVLWNPFFFIRKNLFTNINELAPLLTGRVLDFGCGAKPYRSSFVNCEEYIGCDIDMSGHSHENENVDCFYNGKTLPFQDESFDGIFSSEVFEHIFNLEDIIIELQRVLKTGGVMLVTLPFVWNEHEQPYDFGRYTSFGITDLLSRNGFEVIELRKSTLYFEAIWQMGIEFFRSSFHAHVSNRYILLLFQLLVLAPSTFLGILLAWVFPKNDTLYNDVIVLCRKKYISKNY